MKKISEWAFSFSASLCLAIWPSLVEAANTPVKMFEVSEYGAKADSKENAREAINKAIEAATACGEPAEVILDKGEYRIFAPTVDQNSQMEFAFTVKDARNLVIRGQGDGVTRLVFTNPRTGGFTLKKCEHVTLKGFSVDYDPLPFTQGTILATDPNKHTWDLKIDPGYLELDNPIFSQANNRYGQSVHEGDKLGRVVFSSEWTKTGDRTWRMKQGGNWWDGAVESSNIAELGVIPGVRFYHMARNYGIVIWLDGCKDMLLEGITVYAGPSLAIGGGCNEAFTIRNCHTAIPKDSGHMIATNADAVHFGESRGPVIIEDCSFDGQADDCINLKSGMRGILGSPSPDKVVISNAEGFRQGDNLIILDAATSQIRGKAVLKKIEPQRYGTLLTFEPPISGIKAGKLEMQGESHIAEVKGADLLSNQSTRANPFIIRRNHLKGHGGLVLSVDGGIIEDNIVERDLLGRGVNLWSSGYPWYEGPASRNIIIRKNTFIGQPTAYASPEVYKRTWAHIAAVLVDARIEGGGVSKGLHENIRIENNRFINPASAAIAIRSAKDVSVKNNTIERAADAERVLDSYSSVVIEASEGVAIDGLTINDKDVRQKAVIDIAQSVTAGSAGVSIRGIKADIASGAVEVRDQRMP